MVKTAKYFKGLRLPQSPRMNTPQFAGGREEASKDGFLEEVASKLYFQGE